MKQNTGNQTNAAVAITMQLAMIVVATLVGGQAFAQTQPTGPLLLGNIGALQKALTEPAQQRRSIEIPADLAKKWLSETDEAAWKAVQQKSPTKINLKPLLRQGTPAPKPLTPEWLADGIDPFAIYSKDGDLKKILIRGVGVDPSRFAHETIRTARANGESTKALTTTEGDEQRSSLTQNLFKKAQQAADAICKWDTKPEQVSIGVSAGFIVEGSVEATFKTVDLCKWLAMGTEPVRKQ